MRHYFSALSTAFASKNWIMKQISIKVFVRLFVIYFCRAIAYASTRSDVAQSALLPPLFVRSSVCPPVTLMYRGGVDLDRCVA